MRRPRLGLFLCAFLLPGCTVGNPDFCPDTDPACAQAATDASETSADLGRSGREDARVLVHDLRHHEPPPDLRPACTTGDECPSGICRDGTCAPPDDVIYVDNQNGDCRGMHAGTQADPFCTTTEAVDAVKNTGKKLVRIAGSTAAYTYMDLADLTVGFYGPGGYAMPPASVEGGWVLAVPHSALSVSGNAHVLIDGLQLAHGPEEVVSCFTMPGAGSPTLTLRKSRVALGTGSGIFAEQCTLFVDRTGIARNGLAGIDGRDGMKLEVLNSVVALNRWVGISAPQGEARVRFSTLANNQGGAMRCGNTGTKRIEASLVVYNAQALGGSQLDAGCRLEHSAIDEAAWKNGADNRFMAQPDFVANSIYQLDRTMRSADCCIDQLDRAAAGGVDSDFQDTPRPQGPAWDIGHYELK